jgi:hypothetical protein
VRAFPGDDSVVAGRVQKMELLIFRMKDVKDRIVVTMKRNESSERSCWNMLQPLKEVLTSTS